MTAVADRHLLFGLLALQNGLINQGQLVAAFQAWTLERSKSLADHLEARGDLTAAKRVLLDGLVEVHLEAHGNDVEQSLAAVSAGKSTKESLARIGSPEINATLGHVALALGLTENGASDRTTSYAVGSATSDGQRFRILRPHARGGLGEVFVALDAELNREVALKQILEHHADDPTSRTRFVLEAEVTGGLEHPGIVPVYGLGSYGDGRPYYAMRFVRGDSLKETIAEFHADETLRKDQGRRSLELRKLLRRFVDVCNAIDYAHTRGILHRDIKPANVIVGKHGETLVVDWGLAKPLGRAEPGSASGERTLMPSSASGSAETLPGSAMGTPAYMSPEQAAGELDRVGPRSDVYSLGATLYCLLTGKPPFEGEDLGAVLRAVGKGDLPPPRGVDPSIDRALEMVCLKAMALKPEDRYATPRELADDVERWAADEPVIAWREPWSRRLLRWLTRHRTGVTAAAAALLVALAGTGAVLAVQTQANQELKRSNVDLAIANAKVIKSNSDLQAANERERQRFDLALEAIKLFHGEVSEDLLLKERQFEVLRAKLLKGAAGFYGKLEGLLKGQTDPKSRGALGRAYFELAELTGRIGNWAEAIAIQRKALAVRRELAERPGNGGEVMLDVVRSLKALGTGLGALGDERGEEAAYEEARTLAEASLAADPGSHEARFLLASCLGSMSYSVAEQRPEEGLEAARHALVIMQHVAGTNPAPTRYQEELSSCHFAIAYILSTMGRPAESIAAYEQCVTIEQRLADAQPEVFRFQDTLARLHNNIASQLWTLNKRVESLAALRRAVAIWQKAADVSPVVTSLQNNVAFGLNGLASRLIEAGLPAEALEALAKSRPILQKLTDDDPTTISHPRNLVRNYQYTGDALAQMGVTHESQKAYAKGPELLEKLVVAHPSNKPLELLLVDSLWTVGWRLWELGQAAVAVATIGRERVIRLKLVEEDPTSSESRDRLANCETNMAAALTAMGRLTEAREYCDRAIMIREVLVKDHPENDGYHANLAESLLRSGAVGRAAGDAAGATADWRHAAALYASHSPPPGAEPTIFRACCHGSLAGLAGVEGSGVSSAEGTTQTEEAMAILSRAIAAGYRDVDLLRVEPGLEPLRSRDDFRLLMMDLMMPLQPFAPSD